MICSFFILTALVREYYEIIANVVRSAFSIFYNVVQQRCNDSIAVQPHIYQYFGHSVKRYIDAGYEEAVLSAAIFAELGILKLSDKFYIDASQNIPLPTVFFALREPSWQNSKP